MGKSSPLALLFLNYALRVALAMGAAPRETLSPADTG